ncbi:unnamed protein product [Urochloa humidicola]
MCRRRRLSNSHACPAPPPQLTLRGVPSARRTALPPATSAHLAASRRKAPPLAVPDLHSCPHTIFLSSTGQATTKGRIPLSPSSVSIQRNVVLTDLRRPTTVARLVQRFHTGNKIQSMVGKAKPLGVIAE